MILGYHIATDTCQVKVYRSPTGNYEACLVIHGMIVQRAFSPAKDDAIENVWRAFRSLVVIKDHSVESYNGDPTQHLGSIRV